LRALGESVCKHLLLFTQRNVRVFYRLSSTYDRLLTNAGPDWSVLIGPECSLGGFFGARTEAIGLSLHSAAQTLCTTIPSGIAAAAPELRRRGGNGEVKGCDLLLLYLLELRLSVGAVDLRNPSDGGVGHGRYAPQQRAAMTLH
jgi:hypothetical protein